VRRRNATTALLLAALACVALACNARAQTGNGKTQEGGLEFLFPIGARTLGMGQAAVASAVGSDAVWWNPALIARGPREAAFHISSKASIADADAAGVVVIPVRGVGSFALSARYINVGSQEATGRDSTTVTGTFVNTATILAATFAAPFGDRLSVGFTAKLLRNDRSCSGVCGDAGAQSQTSALDLGGHYLITKDSTFTVGAAVRNIGFKLQVNDEPQSDPLPARGELGISYAPKISELPKEARLRTAFDVVTQLKDGASNGYRFGAELAWLERYQVRAGYVQNGPTGSGATFGLGFNTGKLQVDFSQMLSDLADQGSKPTFVTLRYLF